MLDGPRCSCGNNGCWEAYVANPATRARYFGRPAGPGPRDARDRQFTIEDLVARARGGDAKAVAAIEATARYLGLGLASVINVVDPDVIVLGGGMSNVARLYRNVPALLGRYVFSDRCDTPVVPALHGDSSGVRGAAWLWEA